MGVAAGENDVDHLGPGAEGFSDLLGIEHAIADGVVDFIEDDEVPFAGEDGFARFGPGGFDEANVFGIGLGAADFHEAATHLLEDEVGGVGEDGVELAVVPGAFEELQNKDAHAVADGAQSGSEGCGGFALAGTGVDEDEAAAGGSLGRVHSTEFIVLSSQFLVQSSWVRVECLQSSQLEVYSSGCLEQRAQKATVN